MKVGVISDIHGNKVAFNAVLEDMPAVDELVCLGDVVGYNPWPADCVELVREHADVCVIGNHGKALLEGYEKYRPNAMAYEGLKFADEQLTQPQKEWLASLPEETLAGNGKLRVVHSHPDPSVRWTRDGYVYPRSFTRMGDYMGDTKISNKTIVSLAMGHTHVQHAVDLSHHDNYGIALNPGSVGQPRDDDSRAAYAVLDLDKEKYALHRVEYDIKTVQGAIRDSNLPTKTALRLEKGE